ncbi:MAG: hypothetical protein JJE45_03530 [Prolixibacteraceae bacterium]|nr:hypothetical protein [Prolixibacteraceae bacterium]
MDNTAELNEKPIGKLLFIFVFHMGIRGAAIATVCSKIIALIWQILQIRDLDEIIHLDVRNSRFEKEIVKNIINIGMPQFILNAAACFVAILINKGLMHYGGDFATAITSCCFITGTFFGL